jgi:preprotein translocase subunit SecY
VVVVVVVIIIIIIIIIFLQGLGQRPVPVQSLTSEFMNLFGHFGRTPWTEDQPDATPLPT